MRTCMKIYRHGRNIFYIIVHLLIEILKSLYENFSYFTDVPVRDQILNGIRKFILKLQSRLIKNY